MKIFLSWSGATSRAFAHKAQEFLGQILPWASIYISDDEIESGERWLSNINDALEGSSYGIIFLTNANKTAPWVLFEAGALSKRIAESRVVPLLCDIEDIDLTGNPLSQFQYRKLNKVDVERLVRDISAKSDVAVSWERLSKTFEKFWPDFEPEFVKLQETSAAERQAAASALPKSRGAQKVDLEQLQDSLNEILHSVRSNSRFSSVGNALRPPRSIASAPNALGGGDDYVVRFDVGDPNYYGDFLPERNVGYVRSKSDGLIVKTLGGGEDRSPDYWKSRFTRVIHRLNREDGRA